MNALQKQKAIQHATRMRYSAQREVVAAGFYGVEDHKTKVWRNEYTFHRIKLLVTLGLIEESKGFDICTKNLEVEYGSKDPR